jgi:hypothetical protein
MKFVDIAIFRKYYRTREELVRDGVPDTTEKMKDDIANRPNILDSLLTSNFLESMTNTGRVIIEDNVKLRDYREEVFGKFTESIPLLDTSRFPSTPLPSSFAHPIDKYSSDMTSKQSGETWTYTSGQKLKGTMIPQTYEKQ